MILRLLSLGTELTPSVRESQAAIEHTFKRILDEGYSFQSFQNEKDFIKEMTAAVSDDYMIVLGTEPALFNAFKNFIGRSFNFKMKPNKVILKRIQEKHPELDGEAVITQSLIPSSASPLLSQDGVYSGFAVKTKKQILIVLPLDDNRIDNIINRSLQPYIRANMNMSVLVADPLENVNPDKEKPVTRHASNGALYNVQLIKSTIKKLAANGLTVAVANTKTVDFLGNISTTSVDLSKVVFISPYFSEKGDLSGREDAVDLAKGALINSSNSVGASITKVFSAPNETGAPEMFMYVCIADKQNANVAKLVAEEGETPPQLIYKAIDELFKMLDLWADTGYAKPQFTDESVVREQKDAEDSDKKNKTIKIAVSSMIAASAIVSSCVSVFLTNIYGLLG